MSTVERALPILLIAASCCALGVSCGLLAPIEPLPNQVPDGESGASAAGGTPQEGGGSTGGAAPEDGGASGREPGAGAAAGQSDAVTGDAGHAGHAEPSEGGRGHATPCEPEIVGDITDQSDAGAQVLQASVRGLGLRIRGNAGAVRLDASSYRVLALDTTSHVVYADVPRDSQAAWSPQWLMVGGDYYQFDGSPTAAAENATRMWMFAASFAQHQLYQSAWDGTSWSAPVPAGIRLLGDPVAVATGLGNLLIAGRCDNSRICLTKQSLATLELLKESSWTLLPVETNYQPVALERGDGVHLAATAKGGAVMHGQMRPGESEVTWTELDGLCLRSAPALISRALSLDLFGQGLDGALYWQSRVGEKWRGWVKISRVLATGPLVVTDGADGILIASMDDLGYMWIRRFANGLWTGWTSFRAYGAIADQPFPGSALVLGQSDIRLLLADHTSDLFELALTL